jgi:hypothetical protein
MVYNIIANNAYLTQEQHRTVTQDNNVEFGDDKANLDADNTTVPIGIPIDIDEDYGHRLLQDDDEEDDD